jgi:hypothetical protein
LEFRRTDQNRQRRKLAQKMAMIKESRQAANMVVV